MKIPKTTPHNRITANFDNVQEIEDFMYQEELNNQNEWEDQFE